jgi:protein TonB
MPQFPGGEEELMKFLKNNITYPQMAKENGVQGTVYVTFEVSSKGKVINSKILRGIGSGCDEEALRVVKKMPVWKPGKQNGKSVNVQYNLPIKFILQ